MPSTNAPSPNQQVDVLRTRARFKQQPEKKDAKKDSHETQCSFGTAYHRSQFYQDIIIPFCGYNREGAKISEGIRDNWWRQGMMGGIKAHYDCIKVFSETEFYEDLPIIDVPVLVIHGEDDQIAPYAVTAARSIKLLKRGTLKAYPGFPHGMPTTPAEFTNADLLEFIQTDHSNQQAPENSAKRVLVGATA